MESLCCLERVDDCWDASGPLGAQVANTAEPANTTPPSPPAPKYRNLIIRLTSATGEEGAPPIPDGAL
jgi:hypothetical protein